MDLNGLKRVLCLFGLLAVMSPLVGCPGALIGRSGPQEPKLFFGVPAVEEKTEFSWWDWGKAPLPGSPALRRSFSGGRLPVIEIPGPVREDGALLTSGTKKYCPPHIFTLPHR